MSDLDDRYSPQAYIERLKAQLAQSDVELRIARQAMADVASTAEKACERLLLYQPVVRAARAIVKAFIVGDDQAGEDACVRLCQAVAHLPPEPS